MDVSSITVALNSIKAAIDIAKLIKDSDISLEKAETKLKFADLISALADAKVKLSDIQQELTEKAEEIKELKEQLSRKQNIKYEAPFYWRYEGEIKHGPFCQLCYDRDNKLIRLQDHVGGSFICGSCHNSVGDCSNNRNLDRKRNDWNPLR